MDTRGFLPSPCSSSCSRRSPFPSSRLSVFSGDLVPEALRSGKFIGRSNVSRGQWRVKSSSEGTSRRPNCGGDNGDEKVQDMLADIVRLQSGRAEVEEFAAQKAESLIQVVRGADEDLQKIVQAASQGMDDAHARVLEEVESQVQELEKELAAARAEQKARDEELEEFEKQLVDKQNAGLFFKSLYQKPPILPSPSKEEVMKANPALANATKEAARSQFRLGLYGVFAALASLTLGEAIVDRAPWTTIIATASILVALIVQFVYEVSLNRSE